ncbi:MAG: WhiB family transcriptional regulator [Ilumatobacter sp.]
MLTEPHTTSCTDHVHHQTPAFTPLIGRARCSDGRGTLAHLFFSDEDLDIARAKAICRTCSLQVTCLERAITFHEAYGVWGGTL